MTSFFVKMAAHRIRDRIQSQRRDEDVEKRRHIEVLQLISYDGVRHVDDERSSIFVSREKHRRGTIDFRLEENQNR